MYGIIIHLVPFNVHNVFLLLVATWVWIYIHCINVSTLINRIYLWISLWLSSWNMLWCLMSRIYNILIGIQHILFLVYILRTMSLMSKFFTNVSQLTAVWYLQCCTWHVSWISTMFTLAYIASYYYMESIFYTLFYEVLVGSNINSQAQNLQVSLEFFG